MKVLTNYWKDYEDNKDCFVPGFLSNDILRLWRTFCINYEARSKSDSEFEKAKRKVKNYKLKHSRLLICYSSIVFLLAKHSAYKTVTIADAVEMSEKKPLERFGAVADIDQRQSVKDRVDKIVDLYDQFLERTNQSEDIMIKIFMEKEAYETYKISQYELGNQVARLIDEVGKESLFHRVLLV